jgi:pimeloyl-ACP methyl ester carboxylesterase
MHYVESGEGTPVLLIPGAFCTYRVWDRVIPSLSKKYRVIALDYLGVGDSDKPVEGFGYTVEEQADVIAGMIRELKLRKVRLVGVSYGSMTALNLAVRYPDLAETVVCIEGGAFIFPELLRYKGVNVVLGWPVIGDLFLGLMKTGLFKGTVASSVMGSAWESLTPAKKEEIQSILFANVKTASRVSWYRIDREIRGAIDFSEAAKRSTVPVLYLYGGASKYREMAEKNAEFLRKNLPKTEIVYLEGGIHDLQMQHPELVAGIIMQSWGKEAAGHIQVADPESVKVADHGDGGNVLQ